jgi:peptidyl-prolyl cis-trans isomerase A (cyclophilin A)
MKRQLSLISLAIFAVLASCKADKEPEKPATTPAPAVAKTSKVRLKTNKGDIVIELDAEKAPVTVANFLSYVNQKHYDGTVFHRVIDGFMIQGGGFALDGTKLVEKESGKGIVNEGKNGLKNSTGTIAMARTNDPNSATSQFFINVADNDMLNFPSNGGYAVFGKVVEGMEVVNKIKGISTTTATLTMRHPSTGEKIEAPAGDVPTDNMVIESAKAE